VQRFRIRWHVRVLRFVRARYRYVIELSL
jgi:hypothetical protein